MRLAVASGKGGTGKTLVATNLAWSLACRRDGVTYLDADVEAPNGHLFFRPTFASVDRHVVRIPMFAGPSCSGCGQCAEECQFGASVASHGSLPMLCPYATSKGALNVLTRNVAYSVMRDRIRVNSLNIGWMDTPGEDLIQRRYHSDGKDWLAEAEAKLPFGRLLKMDEVARAIAYLASDESGMMTGANVDFDQSVIGAGPQPIPPPIEDWDPVAGVSFS